MSRIIWSMSVSLDGYMEAPGHDLSWSRIDEELHQHFNDWLATAGAFLGGRTTYELMAAFWPTAGQDPDSSPTEVEFAAIWREKPKVVYSRTMTEVDDQTIVFRDVVPDEVRALQDRFDGDLSVGGSHLGAEFLRLGLIDEFRVYVHPVLIGRGTPMLQPQDIGEIPLELVGTHTFGSGVVLLTHRPITS